MSKTTSKPTTLRRVFVLPTAEENRKIVALAKLDPDALPLTTGQLKAMVPLKSLMGRPKSDNKKQLVSVRYSPEVLTYFRSTGEGWQSRMDGVLRQYVTKVGEHPTATKRAKSSVLRSRSSLRPSQAAHVKR